MTPDQEEIKSLTLQRNMLLESVEELKRVNDNLQKGPDPFAYDSELKRAFERAEKAEKLYDNASAMFHEMQNKYYALREDVKPLLVAMPPFKAKNEFLSKHPELQ